MSGWKKGLAAIVMIAIVMTAAPAASGIAPTVPTLDPDDWEVPLVFNDAFPSYFTDGMFDDDPTGLIPKTPFVQRYSLDQDHWEVWLCGSVTRTMPQVLADLENATVDYFDALSGGVYEPVFTPGGTKPDDANCLPEFRAGDYLPAGTPEGLLIIDPVTNGGYASSGVMCISDDPDCSWISATFPDNGRYAVLGQNSLVNFPSITAHELGHTLQWPHSNSGASEYDNPLDLMSGNRTTGGSTNPNPYATLSYNRFQSGWVSPSDVVVADDTYQAVTLQPFDVAGTQLFAIKTALPGRFYVFGARTTSAYDPIPSEWQGVEVYEVDYYCDNPSFGGGICPGLFRDHTQEPPSPNQVLHVLNPGESIVLEGLTVTVTGTTATGYTLTSDPDPGVDTEPSAPGIPSVVVGDEQATISWDAAGDGGSPILNYDLEVEDRDAGGSTVSDVGLVLSAVSAGLSNGTTYRARVRATNAIGDGPWSEWSSDFVPGAVPDTPGDPSLTAGNTQIAAVWDAPGDDGGLPITNYEMHVDDETGGSDIFLDNGPGLTADLGGLTNGNTYRVRVRAENGKGAGDWSGWSSSVVPATAPSAPLSPTITVAAADAADAAWSAPESDGGLDLVGYQVVVENRTVASTSTIDLGPATTLALSALNTGDTYRYRVRAENGVGWGEWSVWSPDFIPGTVPSAPGVPDVTAGDAVLSAVWPAAVGIGTPVDGYELELDDVTAAAISTHDVGLALTHTLVSLINGNTHRVRVRAHNISGWGPWSGWSDTAIPLAPPNTFIDDDGSVFEADIEWLATAGITKGCNPPLNDRFCPESSVTRGQMAAFLVRALGLTDDGGGNGFVDDDGSVFETDIAKLAAAGITKGCNPPVSDEYCPAKPLTRGQMAAFLVRALGLTDDGGGNGFVDDDGSAFETDIAKLAAAGITAGCNPPTNDKFCPESPVTRGQMAAFLHRALG